MVIHYKQENITCIKKYLLILRVIKLKIKGNIMTPFKYLNKFYRDDFPQTYAFNNAFNAVYYIVKKKY
jgi:hypothetical protein